MHLLVVVVAMIELSGEEIRFANDDGIEQRRVVATATHIITMSKCMVSAPAQLEDACRSDWSP